MALDGDRLGTAIAATIQSFKPDPDQKITASTLEQMWQAIAKDIVDEFENNAVVNNTGTSTVASGSSSGSWPVTSTGTIT